MINTNRNTNEATALIVIDIQKDYFAGGAMELVNPEGAADNAARLIAAFRERALPVIHIQHEMVPEMKMPFLLVGTRGQEIHPKVAPIAGESVITKKFPSAFQQTDLDARLKALGVQHLTVVGMMTQLCVCSTTHSAFERGYSVTLVGDATATRSLPFGRKMVPADWIWAANLASLDRTFATVVDTNTRIGSMVSGTVVKELG